MMTKPPGFASSSTLPLEDEEESIDESLDEILLEANERPSDNSVKSLEAVPSSLESSEEDDSDEVPTRAQGDVTVLAPRPTFFDEEVREEETKVDPFETAIRAAASRDNGLTTQASQQRDRALRKSTSAPRLPTVRAASAAADVEFEDPETGDNAVYGGASAEDDHSARTPADIPVSEDEDSSPAAGYLAGGASVGFQSRLPPPMRSAPPPGRPDIYPGRRIPTPSSDFLQASTGGFGSGSHYPSIAIPAPSAQDSSTRTAAVLADNRLRVPAVGLVGFLVTAFGVGLLFGAILWRGHIESAPMPLPVVTHVAPKMITEPVQPIVKPVPPPAPAPQITPTPVPAAVATAPAAANPPTMAAETAPPAPAAVEPAPTKTNKKSASSSSSSSASRTAKKAGSIDEDAVLNGDDAPPPPPPRPARKKKVVWQDPFAQ